MTGLRASIARSRPGRFCALVLCGLLSGCSGVFQRSIPEIPATWAVRATGDVLRVGAAEREITPPLGGYMAGFGLARTSAGVASPLKVRAMVFELGDRRFADAFHAASLS